MLPLVSKWLSTTILQYYKLGMYFALSCVIQMNCLCQLCLCLCQFFFLTGAILLHAFSAPAERRQRAEKGTVLLPGSSQWIYSFSLEKYWNRAELPYLWVPTGRRQEKEGRGCEGKGIHFPKMEKRKRKSARPPSAISYCCLHCRWKSSPQGHNPWSPIGLLECFFWC